VNKIKQPQRLNLSYEYISKIGPSLCDAFCRARGQGASTLCCSTRTRTACYYGADMISDTKNCGE